MRVLLTNDDGMPAAGIQRLREALVQVAGVDLLVIAPDGNRSAIGRGITTRRPLGVERVDFPDGTHGWQTDGTPTDCVRLAALELEPGWTPELVVSGINHGANLGDDVGYSGTVAAAMEGLIQGLPAVAVSQHWKRLHNEDVFGEGMDFSHAARFTARLVEGIEEVELEPGTLINVNVPSTEPVGLEVCRVGRRVYNDEMELEEDLGGGRFTYRITGTPPGFEEEPGTDLAAVGAGKIAISPLHLDLTHHDGIGPLSEAQLDKLLEPAVREFE